MPGYEKQLNLDFRTRAEKIQKIQNKLANNIPLDPQEAKLYVETFAEERKDDQYRNGRYGN